MTKNNSSNQNYTNNADGFDISGGATSRTLTVTNGNVQIAGAGVGTFIFPATSDTLMGRASADTISGKKTFSTGTGGATFNFAQASAPNSPAEGDIWGDSAQRGTAAFTSGVKQFLVGTIFTQTADQTVSNTVAETTILGTGVGTKTLPANFFIVGKTIHLRVGGVYSTPIASTPSVVVKVKYGSTVIATITTTGLLSGASSLEFDGDLIITCRSTGISGTVIVHGDIEYATGVAGTNNIDPLNNSGNTTTIDTTSSNILDVTVVWDSATSTRIAKSTVCFIKVLN